jgi:hypothetical protein
MRDWLRGAIGNDRELRADLTGVEYGYVLRESRDAIELERKEDMKRHGLASSDDGCARIDLPLSIRWRPRIAAVSPVGYISLNTIRSRRYGSRWVASGAIREQRLPR